jgi:hypothetical protein
VLAVQVVLAYLQALQAQEYLAAAVGVAVLTLERLAVSAV